MRQYKQEVRDKVLEAVAGGMSARGAAREFGVGDGAARRWVDEARRTGRTSPGRKGAPREPVLAPFERLIRDEVATNAAVDVDGIRLLVSLEGKPTVSRTTVWAFLDRLGLVARAGNRRVIVRPARS